MEDKHPTINERINTFINEITKGGFEEIVDYERDQLGYFYIPTPEDTRIFRKDNISVWVYPSQNKAVVNMNENQFLGSRNFTDFIYG